MRKSTLLIMTATIAAIITTSVLAFVLPNQVFAQSSMQIFVRNGLGQTLAGHEAQEGKILAAHVPPATLPSILVRGEDLDIVGEHPFP